MLRRGEVIAQRPEVERERAIDAAIYLAVVDVVPRVHHHVVVVDRVGDEPFPGRGAVGVVGHRPEPAVGDVHQRIGKGERDSLAVGLVGLEILVGPPDAGAGVLVGGDDPGVAQAVVGPGDAAVPRRADRRLRFPVIVDRHRPALTRTLWPGERREPGVPVLPELGRLAVLHHAVHHQGMLQIDLHRRRLPHHSVGDPVPTGQAAVGPDSP